MVQDAHADDRHGEDGRCEGRAEQGRKERGHPGQGCRAQVPVVQVQHPPDVEADGAAHLKRCTFTPGGPADQMRQKRREKNRRNQVQLQPPAGLHLADDAVGALPLYGEERVNPRNGESRRRQQPQEPVVRRAPRRDGVHPQVKGRPQQPAENAGNSGYQDPFCQRPHIDHNHRGLVPHQGRKPLQIPHTNYLLLQFRWNWNYMPISGKKQGAKRSTIRFVLRNPLTGFSCQFLSFEIYCFSYT